MPAKKVRFYQFTGFSVCLSVYLLATISRSWGLHVELLIGSSRKHCHRCVFGQESHLHLDHDTEKENLRNFVAVFTVANGPIPCRHIACCGLLVENFVYFNGIALFIVIT